MNQINQNEQRAIGKMRRNARALQALIDTIEATGGVCDDDHGNTVPVGDKEWPDLASAYLLACEALGRPPMHWGTIDLDTLS